ncbi:MAG: septum formation initiator family protein [Lachnospiraceae bacterium]
MATLTSRKRRMRKHLASLAIVGIAMVMFVCVMFVGFQLRQTNKQKEARIQELEQQIAAEEERSEEIEEYGKYVQTKQFVEEVAKEKLGLVNEDEIIFKAED